VRRWPARSALVARFLLGPGWRLGRLGLRFPPGPGCRFRAAPFRWPGAL